MYEQKVSEQKMPVHVVADIGGTNARFAFITDRHATLQGIESFECARFGHIEELIQTYWRWLDQSGYRQQSLCLAFAGPVTGDKLKLINRDWHFSRSALEAGIGVPLKVINDFGAQAILLGHLQREELHWLQNPAISGSPGLDGQSGSRAGFWTMVGPGTGFGAASLTPGGEIVSSEPGHISFAPVNEHEDALLAILRQRLGRVSVEDVLSGPGLANLYWANRRLDARKATGGARRESDIPPLQAPEVVNAALYPDAAEHEHAANAVRDFTAILGSVCGDLALVTGCRGGLFLSGGMLRKMAALFDEALFVGRFRDKGPFSDWCADIPVARVLTPHPGLQGCAWYSATHFVYEEKQCY